MTSVKRVISLLVCYLLLNGSFLFAGFPDTLRIKKNEILFFNDSLVTFPTDTVIERPPGVAIFRPGNRIEATRKFYDSLRTRTEQKKWIRKLFDLLIISDRDAPAQTMEPVTSAKKFDRYRGYTIRSIKYFTLDPFGPLIQDTILHDPKGIQHSLNILHIATKERILKQNLLFKPGDPINPSLLSDNERLLRQLPFIKDARIVIVPEGEGVADILVIARDVFSLAGTYDYLNPEAGQISVYENNFMGLGHQVKATGLYDYQKESPWGWAAGYRVDNISRSFISGRLNLYNAFAQQRADLSFSRDFFSPFIKNAGGVSLSLAFVHKQLPGDSLIRPLRYSYQDFWYGRSFLLDADKRNRIIAAGRYYVNNVLERPEIKPFEYHRLQRYQLLIGGVSFVKDAYYRSGLIYNFGTTEDIPRGFRLTLTGGYEWNEFSNRPYSGIDLSFGSYSVRSGYFNGGIAWGGFIENRSLTQGVFHLRTSYFTPIITAGRFYLRQFADLDFTAGIRRYRDETITINNELGLRGFSSDSLLGTRRLTLQLETVAFSPLYIYGFRFAFFAFADFGVLDKGDILFTDNKLYSGIGAGVRIRNENLVFKTFQIRLGFLRKKRF